MMTREALIDSGLPPPPLGEGWGEGLHSKSDALTRSLRKRGLNQCFPRVSAAQRGFSLIELVIVVVIVSVLMALFLNRVWYYQELAEKTAMEEVASGIQSALTLQHGKHYIRGNTEDINLLPTENPIKWLQKFPKNYAGEYYDPSPRAVAPGNWMFDLRARELIYVVDRSEHFVPGKDGKKWIRFHISIQNEAIIRGGIQEDNKEIVGSVFEPKEPVNWF